MRSAIRSIRLIAAATLTLLCGISAHGAGAAVSSPEVRKSFQEAYARALTNVTEAGEADSESLKNYPLYPYLQAARIQQALGSTDAASLSQADKRAGDFIAVYGQQPVTRSLRRAWLDSLARRSQWNQFLAAYRDA